MHVWRDKFVFRIVEKQISACHDRRTLPSPMKGRHLYSVTCLRRAFVSRSNEAYIPFVQLQRLSKVLATPVLSDSSLPLVHSLTGEIFRNFSEF